MIRAGSSSGGKYAWQVCVQCRRTPENGNTELFPRSDFTQQLLV